MLSAARGYDASQQLEFGYLQAIRWTNEKREQSHHSVAIVTTTETGQAISNKLHNDETKIHAEYVVPFIQCPSQIHILTVHALSSLPGLHAF